MVTWDAFYPDVLPYIPAGMPEPAIDRQIMRAAQMFCEKTRAWKVDLDPVVIPAGGDTTDLDLDTPLKLIRIEGAWIGTKDCPVEVWKPTVGRRPCGQYIFTPERRTVVMSQRAGAEASVTLLLNVSLMPSDLAAGIDQDDIAQDYAYAISLGARALLNPGGSMQAFQDECDSINTAVWRGNANTRGHVRPYPF